VAGPGVILAAGAVVWRPVDANPDSVEVALVHRPRYDDWSLPKGKLDTGEHVLVAAVREVREETGHTVRLGRPLPIQRYRYRDRTGQERDKQVRYWAARPVAGAFTPTHEVDKLLWVPAGDAPEALTHARDADLLKALAERSVDTAPLVILRHAAALPREEWSGDDEDRPLSAEGVAQAEALRALLAAYLPAVIVSSPARRCVDTVRPYAADAGSETSGIETDPLLSEESFVAAPETAIARVTSLLAHGVPALVCTHRPVLPALIAGLGVTPPSPRLRASELLVLHGARGDVIAVEQHAP
jgi:8-oxo-dGTP pyrophosphatase MutT (NUDIX family)/phosphohistidine phosphatase SixA